MGTPFGPKYVPYTYMDPLGLVWGAYAKMRKFFDFLNWLLGRDPESSKIKNLQMCANICRFFLRKFADLFCENLHIFAKIMPIFAKICIFFAKICKILRKFKFFCENMPSFAKIYRFLQKFADFCEICKFLRKLTDFCESLLIFAKKFLAGTTRFVNNLRMLDIFWII